MGPHTQLTFPKEGHQRPGQSVSDLIVTFKQKPHDDFKRFGNDLIKEHQISLQEAMIAGPISFKTIDNERVELAIDEVITPETMKVIPGKGMPILNNDPLGPIKRDFGRGNLLIKFDIQFPDNMDSKKKNALTELLDEIEEENKQL